MKIKVIYNMQDPEDSENFEEFKKLDDYSIAICDIQKLLNHWRKNKMEDLSEESLEAVSELIEDIYKEMPE